LRLSPSIVLGVKRWISKSYSNSWKGLKYSEKLKTLQKCLFSAEHWAV